MSAWEIVGLASGIVVILGAFVAGGFAWGRDSGFRIGEKHGRETQFQLENARRREMIANLQGELHQLKNERDELLVKLDKGAKEWLKDSESF